MGGGGGEQFVYQKVESNHSGGSWWSRLIDSCRLAPKLRMDGALGRLLELPMLCFRNTQILK